MNIFKDIVLVEYLRKAVESVLGKLYSLAEKLNVSVILVYIVAALLAITVAVFGYRVVKLLFSVSLIPLAITAGLALYPYVIDLIKLDSVPKFVSYIFAIVFASLLCMMCFSKYSFVYFAVLCLAAYSVIFKATGNLVLSMCASLFIALLCVLILRVVVVLGTSFGGSILAVALAGRVLKDVSFLQLEPNDIALIVALGLGLVLAVLQFITARHYKAK